jgi:hypothetical protein
MKTTMVPLLALAMTLPFSLAGVAGEKYIKFDLTSEKPEYISKEDGKKVAGMPDDAQLCEIAFKDVKIPKVVTGEGNKKEQESVDGYEFDCKPSDECKETNKDANLEKTKIKGEIVKQETINQSPERHTEAEEEGKGRCGSEAEGAPGKV